ncbi:MAG: ferredoxin [Spongiibacteraceae bacterium]
MKKVIVDHERCQGHAMCVMYACDLFHLDDNGYNRMQPFELRVVDEDAAYTAVDMCPEKAIKIIES